MFGSSRFTDHFAPQQNDAFEGATEWHPAAKRGGKKQVYRIFGHAGTGKTTLARRFEESLRGTTVYGAFTGKAALQMRLNGCRDAATIHGLIYTTEFREDGSVSYTVNPESPCADADLIVIDECSMVDEDLGNDLCSFGRPILVLGDPAQLPPVSSGGYFTNAEPDHMLTEIHRQAAGNPIIRMANEVRQGRQLDYGDYGTCRIIPRGTLSNEEALEADQILVGKNATRAAYNSKVRRLTGRKSILPERGDRLVCLRNDKTLGLFNGAMFRVSSIVATTQNLITLEIVSEDFPKQPRVKVKVRREFFEGGAESLTSRDKHGTQEFDYGYALTVHKAQGSQWRNVLLYDESGIFRDDWHRWLYTGITRASERLTIVM